MNTIDMVTSLNSIKKAEELPAQCKKSEGGCGAMKFHVNNRDHWKRSIGEFGHLPHEYCYTCREAHKAPEATEIPLIEVTYAEASERYDIACEEGWKPLILRDSGCTCNLNAPCGYCCFDFDAYIDDWCDEVGLKITIKK